MSKKMLKRSLALGALMAFVITGQAWAADAIKDSAIDTWDGSAIVNTQLGGNDLGEKAGENRSYGLAVTTGSPLIDKNVDITNSVSGTNRNYGIVIESGSSLTISGITDVLVSGTGKQQLRGIRNSGGSVLTFDDEVEVDVNLTGGIGNYGDGAAYVTGMDTWNGKTVFNGDVDISAGAEYTSNYDFVNAVQVGTNGVIEFNGDETTLTASNTGYTAVAVNFGDAGGKVFFNSNTTVINANSDKGVNGLGCNDDDHIAIFTGENVTINSTITDGVADTNAIGIFANLSATNTVKNFTVNVTGSGLDNGTYGYANGTAGIYASGLDVDIAAQNLNVTVNGNDSGFANRSDTHGIFADKGGTVQVTSKNINVTVTDSIGEGYGVLAGWRESDTAHAKGGKGTITLGGTDSDITVNVTGNDVTGLMSRGQSVAGEQGSSLEVNGNSLNVTATSTGVAAYGLYVSNGTEDSQYKSDLIINSATTNITATGGENYNIAIANYGQGVTKINGDVTITSDDIAIETRGNAETLINTDENGNSLGNKVVITGDIAYNKQTNNENENIDAVVNISLDGAESEFNGAIVATKKDGTADESLQEKVTTGTTLGLYNGATWNVTKDSFVNTMNGTDGNVVLTTSIDGDSVTATKVDIGTNNNANLTVSGDDELTKAIEEGTVTDVNAALNTLNNAVTTTNESGEKVAAANTVKTAEGNVLGSYVLTENGAELQENSKSAAVSEAGMNLKAHWRAHMNDMNKRMGELRFANGETGVWTRMVRGESEYEGAKMQYNQYQLGYDEKLSVDKRWTVGAAVTFSEGDSSYATGSSDDKSTAFAIYGSKLNNDGTFVDLIARYARLESDIEDRNYKNGEYDTNGMSVSAEFGKRIQQGNGLWIEPQVELTYGTVDSASVRFADGSVANYGDMDSFIGRVGFSLGKDIKQGNVYARASYLYDFDGETETTFNNGTVSGKPVEQDFGGGWWEVGVGANINLSKATYIYADIEKTFGGEVDTNWQWNLGVRYSF